MKGNTRRRARKGELIHDAVPRSGQTAAHEQGGADQAGGFQLRHPQHIRNVNAFPRHLFQGKIPVLAEDHALPAGCLPQYLHSPQDAGKRVFPANPYHELVGSVQKQIARQDGGRLTIDNMAGRASPSVVVIVHGRQVIVDQRVGMNHFKGSGKGQSFLGKRPQEGACGKKQTGPDPLPACQQAVTRRFPHRVGTGQRGT